MHLRDVGRTPQDRVGRILRVHYYGAPMLTKFPKRTFNCYWQKTDKLSFSKWKTTKLSFAKVPNCHSRKYKIIIRKNTKLSFAKIQNCHSQKFRVFFRKNVERIHA